MKKTPPKSIYNDVTLQQRLNLLSSKSATSELVNMDKMTDPRDREGFLYVKTPKDYQLGYHHKMQEGRSRTTLQQYPDVKIDKYVPRDKVT